MSGLVEFLLARYADDEATAKRGLDGFTDEGWHTVECGVHLGYWAETDCTCRFGTRVLAECEAKRRIVGRHDVVDIEGNCAFCIEPAPCEHLRALAMPYADHDDYDEGWRP